MAGSRAARPERAPAAPAREAQAASLPEPAPPRTAAEVQERNLRAALEVSTLHIVALSGDDDAEVVEEVERQVAFESPYIRQEVLRFRRGLEKAKPVRPKKPVSSDVLKQVWEYVRFHQASGRSDKERKLFDERFMRVDTRRMFELTGAADALDLRLLVELTSRALARIIEGKSPEEIRATFSLPDDLTEEEKLEPVRNPGNDTRLRLLNHLLDRRREVLLSARDAEPAAAPAAAAPAQEDTRTLDDLLNFIGAGDERGGGAAGAAAGGKAKPRAKAKPRPKKPAGGGAIGGGAGSSSAGGGGGSGVGSEGEGPGRPGRAAPATPRGAECEPSTSGRSPSPARNGTDGGSAPHSRAAGGPCPQRGGAAAAAATDRAHAAAANGASAAAAGGAHAGISNGAPAAGARANGGACARTGEPWLPEGTDPRAAVLAAAWAAVAGGAADSSGDDTEASAPGGGDPDAEDVEDAEDLEDLDTLEDLAGPDLQHRLDQDWVARQQEFFGPRSGAAITTLTSLANFRPRRPACGAPAGAARQFGAGDLVPQGAPAAPAAYGSEPRAAHGGACAPDWADPADVAAARRVLQRFLQVSGLGAHLAIVAAGHPAAEPDAHSGAERHAAAADADAGAAAPSVACECARHGSVGQARAGSGASSGGACSSAPGREGSGGGAVACGAVGSMQLRLELRCQNA